MLYRFLQSAYTLIFIKTRQLIVRLLMLSVVGSIVITKANAQKGPFRLGVISCIDILLQVADSCVSAEIENVLFLCTRNSPLHQRPSVNGP